MLGLADTTGSSRRDGDHSGDAGGVEDVELGNLRHVGRLIRGVERGGQYGRH